MRYSTIRKKYFSYSAISLFLNLAALGQSGNSALSTVINKLNTYSSNHAIEKAYLQFDKSYYAAGDTVYFKAYVTAGTKHQLSDLSGVLHVDFINPENNMIQSIKLQIDSGVCWGDFALPDSLPAGDYRIRAYTRLMRNNEEAGFFDRILTVGSLKKEFLSDSLVRNPEQVMNKKADFQFFPEGGNLITGIRTKIAFKAVDTNGLSIDVKGVLLTNNNKEIGTFTSTHAGMGYFFLTPVEGAIYKARLKFANGTQSVVDLPTPQTSGISLAVNNSLITKASVDITANTAYYQANRNKNFFLVVYSGGTVITVPFVFDTYITTLNISKQQLNTGVATITLFSGNGEPLCERLLFIQNNDQLNLQIHTDKTVYSQREKVSLSLNVKDQSAFPAAGHFSVSVLNEKLVPRDTNNEVNILTDLLLTSDLAGYVEQPDYYFSDKSDAVQSNLDLLMLTQGYRRFEWKKLLTDSGAPVTYLPEKGFNINGRVTNLSDKPLENATVNLLPSDGGFVLSRTSDSNGLFHFSNLVFTDTFHFILNAADSKKRNSTKLTYFVNNDNLPLVSVNRYHKTRSVTDTTAFAYLQNEATYHSIMASNSSEKYHVLKEVTVTTKKADNKYRTQSLAGAGHADQVMHADEIGQIGGQLSTSLNGRLHGVGFINGKPYLRGIGNGYMLLVVDGTQIPINDSVPNSVDDIPSSQVETVEVLKYTSASIYGMNAGNGVLVITTKQGSERFGDIASVGVLNIAPVGFYKARTFYSPRYDYKNAMIKQPDLRTTIYWNPDIKTDNNGNASMDFYNADGAGTYKVIIEGIDNNGNIGSQVYGYTVQ